MKFFRAIVFAMLFSLAARAQDFELDTNALKQVVEWAQDNLDEDVLRSLSEVDRTKVEKFLAEFQKQLGDDYVVDLAALKDAATIVLPLLEAHEETQPYAAWLRSRLDYFEVAVELQKIFPPGQLIPGQPPPPRTNPPAELERKTWQKKISKPEWPKAATDLVPKLKPVFIAERVPEQLVWVAEVESGFNPKARSPVGAAGLFQLMPATAKRYGLRSWPRDQRYQTEPSARAAARYLGQLHRQFGDWRLALAAFNAGEGTVQRLLDRYKTRSFDQIAPHLPAETQMFVPKVEATILRREGMEFAKLKAARG